LPLPPLPLITAKNRVPRILFNHGLPTVDGPTIAVFASSTIIASMIAGILIVPKELHYSIPYFFGVNILLESALILSVMTGIKCLVAFWTLIKFIVFLIVFITSTVSTILLYQSEIPTETIAQMLKEVEPEDIAPFMNIIFWLVFMVGLFNSFFTYLHFSSLIETMNRMNEIAHLRQENLSSFPLPRVISSPITDTSV
ncbi:hypothetical protein PFISCL1PPCAC_5883, partial [Pristionchus fissidentatus]